VDKAAFPREKVCGCCLNAAATSRLAALGLGACIERLHSNHLAALRLVCGRAAADIPLRGSFALSRAALDAELVAAAIRAGAAFLDSTYAALDRHDADGVSLRLTRLGTSTAVTCRALVAADGLGGRLLSPRHGFTATIAPRSRIGAGVVLDEAPAEYRSGVVSMACGRGGYVGLVRLEDGRLDVAAAFWPAYLREHSDPGEAGNTILRSCRLPTLPTAVRWRGTPALTRRHRPLQRHRIFAVGDAAAYVEPFTGEGIAWALTSGSAVVRHVARVIEGGVSAGSGGWTPEYNRLLAHRQRACRAIAWGLRRPTLLKASVRALSLAPVLARPFLNAMNRDRRADRHAGGVHA
jgi:flavin-dependent dehydrogenase